MVVLDLLCGFCQQQLRLRSCAHRTVVAALLLRGSPLLDKVIQCCTCLLTDNLFQDAFRTCSVAINFFNAGDHQVSGLRYHTAQGDVEMSAVLNNVQEDFGPLVFDI